MLSIEENDDDDHSGISSTNDEIDDTEEFGGGKAPADDHRDEAEEVKKLTKMENKGVWIWKFLVVIIILATATMVSVGSYTILRQEETENFLTSFDFFANTVRDASQFHLRDITLSMKDLASAITGTANETGQTFPFVTVPAFETLGESVRRKAGLEAIYFGIMLQTIPEVMEWQTYSVEHQDWLVHSRNTAAKSTYGDYNPDNYQTGPITPIVFDLSEEGIPSMSMMGEPPFMPIWHASPPPFNPSFINFNGWPTAKGLIGAISNAREGLFGWPEDLSSFAELVITNEDHDAIHASLVDWVRDGANSTFDHPHSFMSEPVFRVLNDPLSDIVGYLSGLVAWDRYLINLLPEGVSGITCVLKASYQCTGSCNATDWSSWWPGSEPPVRQFTYALDGNSAFYLGEGDMHERLYDDMEVVIPFHKYVQSTLDIPFHTVYSLHVYPTAEFENSYRTQLPLLIACIVASTFLIMSLAFSMYDWFVRRRNNKVMSAAVRSGAIVSSLFPSTVRDRLYKEAEEKAANNARLQKWLHTDGVDADAGAIETDDDVIAYKAKPIADLFPETTILFADIAGFTAWSSAREPHQVFQLLETLYRAFDEIARRRGVFKVETIGDCYVAVTGLPEPRRDHAVVMVRFAKECMQRMHLLVRQLEVSLGPSTSTLDMRFGLHSGPVTAGVLRGERSRFQLFGDTMNTASRMESTGLRGKIQISQDTADRLINAGKTNWITPRQDKVVAKGKGEMQTFWVAIGSKPNTATDMTEASRGSISEEIFEVATPVVPSADPYAAAKQGRLVKWNVEVLLNLLRQVEAHRPQYASTKRASLSTLPKVTEEKSGSTIVDEVQEIVHLPRFTGESKMDLNSVEIGAAVEIELKSYVAKIAALYRDNPFHNFEHASHVTMSVVKLMSRIVAPNLSKEERESGNIASSLHDHTYGITSDPLTQFACVFSALIHDVDHTGVPNTQLLRENPELAAKYKERSIAEQNSVDVAWSLLMEDEFQNLRQAIYRDAGEQQRFRQLVVNSVMATDIMDAEFKQLRNARWEKAFSDEKQSLVVFEESLKDKTDRKATIVIEHLIQASDVSHTMQHWHVYRKWNEHLFAELYKAFAEGRAEKNPADFWVKGELGFFDHYVIPLAKKLKDCGVFGVSSEEYLNYALQNRKEWETRGAEVVSEMVDRLKEAFDSSSSSQTDLTTLAVSSSNSSRGLPPPSQPLRSGGRRHRRSIPAWKDDEPHAPASPVKRAIRLAVNRSLSAEDLMVELSEFNRQRLNI